MVTVRTPTGYWPNFAGSGAAVGEASAKGRSSTGAGTGGVQALASTRVISTIRNMVSPLPIFGSRQVDQPEALRTIDARLVEDRRGVGVENKPSQWEVDAEPAA